MADGVNAAEPTGSISMVNRDAIARNSSQASGCTSVIGGENRNKKAEWQDAT
jgi:hypothetical protein